MKIRFLFFYSEHSAYLCISKVRKMYIELIDSHSITLVYGIFMGLGIAWVTIYGIVNEKRKIKQN